MTYIEKYYNSFKQNGGDTIVSKRIYKLYKKLVADLYKKDGDYYFNQKRANHPIDFIERFCHPSKGKQANKPLKLMLWQKAMIEAIFGFVDIEGNRKYRRVFLLIGRKNGKSAIASALGLYMMIADKENGSQVLATAAKKDQAKIIWQEAKLMVRKSPLLKKMIHTRVADMIADFNDSEFKPLASDS
ncbi:MAG TPA: terminase large subunit, partial [Candidatus Jeotgalibaca merdavium]|nr:terminase large subunit [Candidatus Jeotgalibaca merdavium]